MRISQLTPQLKKPAFKLIWLLLGLLILSLSAFLYFKYPTTSPFKAASYYIYAWQHPRIPLAKQTIAFLPYWRIDDAKYARFDLLTEINYFALTINENGDFVKTAGNEAEPGWSWWNGPAIRDLIAKTQITGGKFSLTILATKNNTIEQFLDKKDAQQKLLNNLIKAATDTKINGITLDFEYLGESDEKYRNEFTQFANNFNKTLREQFPDLKLSLAILPREARITGLFDLKELVPVFDEFIGMSYNYYGSGSETAGPIAPMNGFKDKKFFFDVTTTYEDYLQIIPREKLIMGIPYYGWDWAVEDGKIIKAKTYPQDDERNFAAVMSYARMIHNPDLKPENCKWDEDAQNPWCWYTDDKKIDHQVWYEDKRSIGIKYDFAKKMDFSGIAIWTLGYDKDLPDLWNLMEKTFKKPG